MEEEKNVESRELSLPDMVRLSHVERGGMGGARLFLGGRKMGRCVR
jgi:hypothetical protein